MAGDLLVAVVMLVAGGVLMWATHDRLRLLWRNETGRTSMQRGRDFAAVVLQILVSAPIAVVWGTGVLLVAFGALMVVVRLMGGTA